MKEFDIIEKLKPLALGKPEAAGFANDAACLNVPEGYELVVTSDCATMGVHFLADQPPRHNRAKSPAAEYIRPQRHGRKALLLPDVPVTAKG
ncbi:MAG: hypothetical protein LRY76_06380 [Alphaproteobacteria bacterium]|nr:hypothetical protein [Alphaproteobacteria bacterium]